MNNKLSTELMHHGIMGMRWGIRRFQPYPDDYKGSGKEVGKAKVKASKLREDVDLLRNKRSVTRAIDSEIGKTKKRMEKAKVKGNDKKYLKNMARLKVLESMGIAINRDINKSEKKINKDIDTYNSQPHNKLAKVLLFGFGDIKAKAIKPTDIYKGKEILRHMEMDKEIRSIRNDIIEKAGSSVVQTVANKALDKALRNVKRSRAMSDHMFQQQIQNNIQEQMRQMNEHMQNVIQNQMNMTVQQMFNTMEFNNMNTRLMQNTMF